MPGGVTQDMQRLSLTDQTDVAVGEDYYANPNRRPSSAFSPHITSLDQDHINDHEAAHEKLDTSSDAVLINAGPTISLTPPNDSSTVQCEQDRDSFYRVVADSTDSLFSEISRPPLRLLEQDTWRYGGHQVPRERASSASSTLVKQRRSFDPDAVSRRHGMIILSGLDSAFNGHRLRVAMGTYDRAPADEDQQSCSDSATTQTGSDPASYNLITPNDRTPSLNSSSTVSGSEHDVFPSNNAGGAGVAEDGDSRNEDTAPSKDMRHIGKWRCCECRRGHEIYRFQAGEHLISILNCVCKHRSCRSCTFQGDIRRFAPIDDAAGVASVPVDEGHGNPIRFGVVCRTCGLSWRADKVEMAKHHVRLRRRLSILPKKINPMHRLRSTRSMVHLGLARDRFLEESRPGTAVSLSRSIFNLSPASDTQSRDAKPEEQVKSAEVRFYGIECTCGSITNPSSLCFQVINTPAVDSGVGLKEQTNTGVVREAEPQRVSELQAKGHGTPMLHLKGGCHPNPLLSNPAQKSGSP